MLVYCRHCKDHYSVSDDLAGHHLRCRSCDATLAAPPPVRRSSPPAASKASKTLDDAASPQGEPLHRSPQRRPVVWGKALLWGLAGLSMTATFGSFVRDWQHQDNAVQQCAIAGFGCLCLTGLYTLTRAADAIREALCG